MRRADAVSGVATFVVAAAGHRTSFEARVPAEYPARPAVLTLKSTTLPQPLVDGVTNDAPSSRGNCRSARSSTQQKCKQQKCKALVRRRDRRTSRASRTRRSTSSRSAGTRNN